VDNETVASIQVHRDGEPLSATMDITRKKAEAFKASEALTPACSTLLESILVTNFDSSIRYNPI
jgi:hypothetical protein